MSSCFEKCFLKAVEIEGGFTLHKNPTEDYETYAGIYRKAHPDWKGWEYIDRGEVPPTSLVREFYYKNFFKPFDYPEIPPPLKCALFLTAINIGVKPTIKLIQKVLGTTPDGIIGKVTLSKFKSLSPDLSIASLKNFIILLIGFYLGLANKNPKRYSLYLRGWLNRTYQILEFCSEVE